MDHPLPLISVPLDRVSIDPHHPERSQPSREEDHRLRVSIHRHGILEPLQVCEDGKGDYIVVDGERRYEIAKNSGYRRLVVAIHRFMSGAEREELRLELKRTVKPLTEEDEQAARDWIEGHKLISASPYK